MAAGAAWVERISFMGGTSLIPLFFINAWKKLSACYCISSPGKGQPGKHPRAAYSPNRAGISAALLLKSTKSPERFGQCSKDAPPFPAGY